MEDIDIDANPDDIDVNPDDYEWVNPRRPKLKRRRKSVARGLDFSGVLLVAAAAIGIHRVIAKKWIWEAGRTPVRRQLPLGRTTPAMARARAAARPAVAPRPAMAGAQPIRNSLDAVETLHHGGYDPKTGYMTETISVIGR